MSGSIPFLKRSVVSGSVILLLIILPLASDACLNVPNPEEFRVDLPSESKLLPNGMMVVVYSDSTGERRTHITIHRVLRVLPGRYPSLPELRDPQYKIMETDGTISPMTYLLKANALYYGEGTDSLGFPQKSWIDPEEDGLNGNEHSVSFAG
ncbi:MAG: hypothetical protein NPIRA04_34160 [Nitrospirales bacterium]|nr:MAG: hypothetical protein NPIRA04_34160 [Nitrospirales bacterium]